MGLGPDMLRFIVQQHRRTPLAGPVLTLGRQGVAATLDEVKQILISEGVTPAPLPEGFDTRTNLPNWKAPHLARNTSDVTFFKLLGVDQLQALDSSDYEKADIIHDLNQPVPADLHGRFPFILDGGTLEHVFDVRQALTNISNLLAVGGRVLHISPTNNYVNHGFYQLSPTLYYDYYGVNKFVNLQGFVGDQLSDFDPSPNDLYALQPERQGEMMSSHRLAVIFLAEKGPDSSAGVVPTQCFFAQIHGKVIDITKPRFGRLHAVWFALPNWVKALVQRVIPGLDRRRKPWGLNPPRRLP